MIGDDSHGGDSQLFGQPVTRTEDRGSQSESAFGDLISGNSPETAIAAQDELRALERRVAPYMEITKHATATRKLRTLLKDAPPIVCTKTRTSNASVATARTRKRPAASGKTQVRKHPSTHTKRFNVKLGCCRCRGSPTGCLQCRSKNYHGKRFQYR